ncbi:TlpA family protein disulfide reductase [Alkalitalea saponilacus]|uniref:Thiol-disulfide isomerase or thioredoxin n=1 Tax=Alkalitalea saponilacus TaxID=889453 RepID=A0A1T5HST9_9BACT|nr:TlpA disulfide reductase family protein [Alkalitalea saponilacus]ASB49270.1 redoxin [Alkalitalea saponilacus]SKC23755.1 Thiol-disulfide isomerase or thioredoxin [Alkalitalea saponilacus]
MGIIKQKWNNYRRRKRWWSITLDFLFLVLIVMMLIPTTRKSLSAFIVRQTLLSPRESSKTIFMSEDDWAFRLISYSGEVTTLARKRDKPVFLNYWATWCPPCIAEMPSIQNLYDAYKDDINFVFISNEDLAVVNSFMERRGYNLPLYYPGGPAPETLESSVLPTTFIITPGGRIVLYKTGAAKWDSKRVFEMMDRLINKEEIDGELIF